MLEQVVIRNVRNIRSADVQISPRLTVFSGDNGAGKSSLLEAIYLLSRAGTFRTRSLNTVVSAGELKLSVKAQLANRSSLLINYHRTQGTERTSSLTPVTLREATQILPTIALTADSLQLLSGPPSDRRGFLDWLVFHVKHSFHQHWGHYKTCLSQRNSVLRRPGGDAEELAQLWAVQMKNSAEELHRLRAEVVEKFSSTFTSNHNEIFGPALGAVRVSYSPGWQTDQDWVEVQGRSFSTDCRRGRTELGPHRADLKITVGDRLASEVLSRGQQKALVIGLYLTLLDRFTEETKRRALILVDDITSELDILNAQYIASELVKAQHQVVATVLSDNPFRQLMGTDSKLFHVEHGSFKEIS